LNAPHCESRTYRDSGPPARTPFPGTRLTPSDDRQHTTRTLLILGVAALAFALAQTTVIPAIPELMRALDTDESGVTLTLTGYLVAAAVFTPLMGRLGDMFGKRRLLVISLLAFATGSVVAAVRGALVLAVGLVLRLIAISQAPHLGWGSARTLVLIGAGLAILAFWVVLERRTPQPLADIEALAKTPVLMTNIATLLVGFGMFGSSILIPTLAQAPTSTGYGLGDDATRAGLLLVPGALMMLAFGPLSGIIGGRLGNKVPLAAGGALTGTGLGLLAGRTAARRR